MSVYLNKVNHTVLIRSRGRLLASYGSNTYSYNAEGIRYKKNTTEYILDGERIIAEKENGVITKRYFYDGSGIAGMWYDGEKYYFRKNIQGDVIGIYDETGTNVGSYAYDPWGVVLTSSGTMASLNPFRYRGYYYDSETGLYYLNSRYYDPSTGRFISPDTYSYLEPETVNGLSLYAYALSNPVMNVDPGGHIIISLIIGLAIAGAAIGGTIAGVTAYNSGARGWNLVGAIFGGMLAGGAVGALIGLIAPMAGSLFTGGALAIAGGGTAGLGAVGVVAVGAIVVGGAKIVHVGLNVLFSKDSFIRSLERGMSEYQKEMFQREIEDYKRGEGRGGADNLPKDILRKIAELIKKWYK